MEKDKLIFAASIRLSIDNPSSGIMKKVFAEARVLEESFDVYLWGFNDNSIVFIHDGEMTEVAKFTNNIDKRRKYFKEIALFSIQISAKAFYYRYATCDFPLLKALRRISSRSIKCVIEIPTYPYKGEYSRSIKNRMIYLLDCLTRWRLKYYVDRIVLVTSMPKVLFGIPCINISNGIDFSTTSVVKNPTLTPVKLIAVSSMLPHHGYDRLIEGAKLYYSNIPSKAVAIYLVGDGPEFNKYNRMVTDNSLENIVSICGRLSGRQLDDLFDHSAAAIGSLGLHRLGLKAASTLKIREYVSRGLPVVYSTDDDLLDGKSYGYKLPADESPVPIEKVIEYVEAMYQTDGVNELIRKAAYSLCDMSVVMKPVVDYFVTAIES